MKMSKYLNYHSPFGIYIHIPFCESKCNYCDFYSIKYKKKYVNKYMDFLIKEIELYSKKLKNKKVKAIYLGGGTPSLLTPSEIEKILNIIYSNYTVLEDIEISMEANPESLNENKIKEYKISGINRLSLGVQSFLDNELKFLGRIHNVKKSISVINNVKKYFDNFSLDLIFAIPDQKLEDFKYSLNKSIEFNPKHISLYNLQIEKGTPFYQMLKEDRITEITEELDYKMYNFAINELKKNGYQHYEISNFAKQDYHSKHNLLYWNYKPYLGIGPSAHGFNGKNRYYNIKDIASYINKLAKNEFPIKEIINLTQKELISEMMFMGLRLISGVSKKDFQDRFDITINEVYEDTIKKLKKEGLIKENEQNIYLTKKGINLGNVSFSEFLL